MTQLAEHTHKHMRYTTSPSRLKTFGEYWPRNLPVEICDLVMAGFFYTGKSDWVICFSCGTGLRNLTRKDDLLKIHVKLAPSCAFLKRVHCPQMLSQMFHNVQTLNVRRKVFIPKESDFIIHIQSEVVRDMRTLQSKVKDLKIKGTNGLQHAMQTINTLRKQLKESRITIADLNDSMISKNLKVRDLSRKIECPVCLDKDVSLVANCGHLYCRDCSVLVVECSLCRTNVENFYQVYL